MNTKINQLTVFLLLFSAVLFAQNKLSQKYNFVHIGAEKGLTQTAISDILMDKEGYIWMGTWKGLFRYDAYAMHSYFAVIDDTTKLQSDYINCLYEDQNNTLWIGTMGGLYRYERKLDQFKRINFQLNKVMKVLKIAPRKNKEEVWLCTVNGLYLFNIKNKQLTQIIENRAITNVLEIENTLWVGTKSGLMVVDQKGQVDAKFMALKKPINLNNKSIINLFQDKEGKIWIASWKLFSFNPKTNTFKIEDQNLEVWDFLAIENELWFATTDGICVLDQETLEKKFIKQDRKNTRGLSEDFLTTLYQDKKDNIWIGGFRKGAYFYSPHNNLFELISKDLGGLEILHHNRVMDIYKEDSTIVWLATDGGGITKLNVQTKKSLPLTTLALFNNKAILSIRRDKKGVFWLSTWGDGLFSYNQETNKIQQFKHVEGNGTTLPENNIWQTFEDSEGNFWVSIHEMGLCLFDTDKGEVIERIIHKQRGVEFLTSFYIFEDSNKCVYFCNTQGLIVYNLKSKITDIYFQEGGVENTLPGYSVNCGLEDSKGNIWLGTNNGLALFDKKNKKFYKKGGELGVKGPRVQAIEEDKEGNLWLAVNNQLVKYSTITEEIVVFTTDDIGINGEFIIGASHTLANGQLFFGSTNGVVVFDPKTIRINKVKSPVKLVNFSLFNKKVTLETEDSPLKHVIDQTEKIQLKHYQNVFSIDFSTLNYVQSGQNKYMYLLEGFDKDWQHIGHKRSATFTNLNAGKYTFRVKGANNDGIWNEAKPLIIEQLPPFWLTWWAKLLYLVLFIGLIYFFYRFLMNRHKLERAIEISRIEGQKKAEVNKFREQFFTNISHELRTPLTLIVSPLQAIQKEGENYKFKENQQVFKLMHTNAERLLRLINQLMDFRKVENGLLKVQEKSGDIMRFIKDTSQLYCYQAQQMQIVFTITTAPDSLWVNFDHDKLEKIIHNLLSNAFKYTNEKGSITVHAFLIEKVDANYTIELNVTDNGVGIAEQDIGNIFSRYYMVENSSAKGTGIGLTLTKELVELCKGTINVKSTVGQGTSFNIQLSFKGALPAVSISNKKENNFVIEPTEQPKSNTELKHKQATLLVIDDNIDIQTYLKIELSSIYTICIANNGAEGLKVAIDKTPDLIISDVMMPLMDGMELCHKLKSNIATSHIPVLLLTAKHSDKSHLQGLTQGADEFISKPFNIEILKTRIAYHLKLRKDLQLKFKTEGFIKPKEITTSDPDKIFLDKLYKLVFEELENPEFNTKVLCEKMGMSRTLLHTKLKVLTACSTAEFIKSARMINAAKLLKDQHIQIKEVAYSCGYLNPQQFSNTFVKYHGMSPSKYQEQDDEKKTNYLAKKAVYDGKNKD
ncbi:hybrid sensor histidine kinase/response regulator transcription factor [Flammeovirga kamogawensis]|uniref:histidine kinase n=1 Tax=Flammeovirga kamogawensis TaxID=373891 RepID=A0ABX8H3W8_9BACT|nr:two-component regulator propeller domain-containing protein [Flammeovirga kamogawensis]MBB6460297.1 signal transduction histidine kinase/ligand-binding sensor domain-containing protein/AraC-like DNA-binding protein [Flammeovirga kamogawensis]QWG10107.1 response regulator [Flammeovirga kamogawensis]TRX65614.1 response regulator [Flammeovirga kamogawensis]